MSRARNGLGTVTKRADGRWQAAVYVLTPHGGRQRKFAYGDTWEKANAERIKMLENNRRGMPSVTSSMKLADYLQHWLYDIMQYELREGTFADYEDIEAYAKRSLKKWSARTARNAVA